jgi:hypothetical protein
MIGKWLQRIMLVGSGGVFILALTPSAQRWLSRHKVIPDQYNYGDLYNLSNLAQFREVDYIREATLTQEDKPAKRNSTVDLYTIGDSFTHIDTSFYAGNRNIHSWANYEPTVKAVLDTTKKNILVLEFVERVLQERLYWPDYHINYIQNGIVFADDEKLAPVEKVVVANKPSAPVWLQFRFGSQINQRLEFLLFNNELFLRLKEWKAALLYAVFGRLSGVRLSSNRQHLFYEFEADSVNRASSFKHLTDQQIDTMVTNLNTIRKHYLAKGFDEVYICLIPNKVTVLEPTYGTYNHQIARIEAHPGLQAPLLSTIDTLRQHPDWYHPGDGHWNRKGKQFWIRQVNALAATWAEKR